MENFADRLAALLGVAQDVVPLSWESAEEVIGRPVPSDYIDLISHTGSASLDDWLTVFGPNPSSDVDLASLIEERESAWDYFREHGIQLPGRFFVEGRRLIAFAVVESTYFYWDSRDDLDPDAWGVVIVDGELDNWFEIAMPATECLYKVLVGEIELPPFEGLPLDADHSAGRFGR
ncbi:SMI1/KNR4 family protein [Dactylosporangium sp. CS-033363]|uniref:SMI1/KNR4 family protein n=1 Tax=Dactylosporangium sp. CS-033363 TaxID=3239935 RepID=UPI003D940112